MTDDEPLDLGDFKEGTRIALSDLQDLTIVGSEPVPIIRRNKTNAAAVEEILGLPDERWNNLRVSFGHDLPVVTIDLLPTSEQIQRLTELLG